jgi:maltooligosyltrehalose synthase
VWRSDPDSGAAKLALIRACLRLRRRHAAAFGPEGSYAALDVSGADAARVVAFCRGEAGIAVISRLPRLGLPEDAMVVLPEGNWVNALTNEHHTGEVAFGKLRGGFPVAVLQRDGDPVG